MVAYFVLEAYTDVVLYKIDMINEIQIIFVSIAN